MITIDYQQVQDRPYVNEVLLVKKEKESIYFSDEIEIICEIFCQNGNLLLIRINPNPQEKSNTTFKGFKLK